MAKVYCLDQHNNYVESMSKEDIISAIQTAAEGGSLEGFSNTAFVSKIKEINKRGEFSIWVGSTAEYNKLDTKERDVLYILSDDPLAADMPNKIQALSEVLNGQNTTLLKHENGILMLNEAAGKVNDTLTAHGNTLTAHGDTLTAHGETLNKHDEQLQRVTNVGYTTLFEGSLADYKSVTGVTLSEDYDAFDFLIFEFQEITENALEDPILWKARAMISTYGLSGLSRQGMYFTFLATELRVTAIIDETYKRRVIFLNSNGTTAMLTAIYGYNRKGEE